MLLSRLFTVLGMTISVLVNGGPAAADSNGVEVTYGAGRSRPNVLSDDQNGVEIVHGRPRSRAQIETQRYALSLSERRRIQAGIRMMIEVYRKQLGVVVPSDFGVNLDIVGDPAAFRRRHGSDRSVGGFYSHRTKQAVVSGAADKAFVRSSSLHESSHAILSDQVAGAPVWLSEGLASYFARIESRAGRVVVPAHRERHAELRDALDGGEVLPLSHLLAISPWRWSRLPGERRFHAYTHAWSRVAFLMKDEAGRRVVRRMLADSVPGAARSQGTRILERRYPGGVRAFDRDYRAWLARPMRDHVY